MKFGVKKDDRVVLLAGNSVEHVIVWFALNLIGAADAPINPALRGGPLEHAIRLIEPEIIVAERTLLPVLEELGSPLEGTRQILTFGRGPDMMLNFRGLDLALLDFGGSGEQEDFQSCGSRYSDISSILFTSGTTGPSKGVMVTQAQAFLTARQTVEGLWVGAEDVYYCAHPLFHMSPRFCAIYAALLTGAKVCLDARFSAVDWIGRIRETGATVTIGHGPLLEMIYAVPERSDDSDTKLTRIGTSPFPKHIAADFERRFGIKGIETWGMTEINIPCWHPSDVPLRPGAAGKIREEWYDFKVVDPDTDEELPVGHTGEFVIRPKLPGIISPGYFKNPKATLRAWRNLWFHTGDSGYIDAEGWVYFVDRLGDRIRRRAENISSYDIETAANAHPAVLESAAIGVPSGFISDDDIKLYFVIRPGHQLAPPDLLGFLARQLPHHMVPRYIERVEEMPRTPTQKIRKADLRDAGITPGTWDRKASGVDLRALVGALRKPT